jgi:hypothetical protein
VIALYELLDPTTYLIEPPGHLEGIERKKMMKIIKKKKDRENEKKERTEPKTKLK